MVVYEHENRMIYTTDNNGPKRTDRSCLVLLICYYEKEKISRAALGRDIPPLPLYCSICYSQGTKQNARNNGSREDIGTTHELVMMSAATYLPSEVFKESAQPRLTGRLTATRSWKRVLENKNVLVRMFAYVIFAL